MGVDDGKQVNIPAPPTFNLKGRWYGEESSIESDGPARGRGGFGQSGFFKTSAEKSFSVD
jgi:hypothetical protein